MQPFDICLTILGSFFFFFFFFFPNKVGPCLLLQYPELGFCFSLHLILCPRPLKLRSSIFFIIVYSKRLESRLRILFPMSWPLKSVTWFLWHFLFICLDFMAFTYGHEGQHCNSRRCHWWRIWCQYCPWSSMVRQPEVDLYLFSADRLPSFCNCLW